MPHQMVPELVAAGVPLSSPAMPRVDEHPPGSLGVGTDVEARSAGERTEEQLEAEAFDCSKDINFPAGIDRHVLVSLGRDEHRLLVRFSPVHCRGVRLRSSSMNLLTSR